MLLYYKDALETAKVLDFDDLLCKTVSLLEVPHIGRNLRNQYSHILTDEFQVRGVLE